MRKILAILAVVSGLMLCLHVYAQDTVSGPDSVGLAGADTLVAAAANGLVDEPVPSAGDVMGLSSGGGWHQTLKIKFIEGSALFMSFVAIALIVGLAFCIERIIYLSLAEINTKKFLSAVEGALEQGDVEQAKHIARHTRGPVASICYQGLLRIDQDIDVVEKSVAAYGGVQAGYLEKGCSWITLFITMAPSLGFLGTVIGMVMAFEKIQLAGDLSPDIVAEGMKVALITTIFGLIVAMILQLFYNYILSRIEALTNEMEDASVSLLDMVVRYHQKYKP